MFTLLDFPIDACSIRSLPTIPEGTKHTGHWEWCELLTRMTLEARILVDVTGCSLSLQDLSVDLYLSAATMDDTKWVNLADLDLCLYRGFLD